MKRVPTVAVRSLFAGTVAAGVVAIAALTPLRQPATAQPAPQITINVSSDIPLEVSDPANLTTAATFAWGEFIALTWPALPQGQNNAFPRGKPDTSLKYGDPGKTGQVVWETFRHRVEAFPGQGNPNGYNPSASDLGFARQPDYIYNATLVHSPSGRVPPSNPNWNPPVPPFNNLDEVTQIGLNAMYAGTVAPSSNPGQSTNVKEKILFEAKVNEVVYQYAAQPRTDSSGNTYNYFQSDNTAVQSIKSASVAYLQRGGGPNNKPPSPYISLPPSDPANAKVGSIEIKASFRRLGPNDDPTKYYTAPVRYYTGDSSAPKFVDSNDPAVNEVWGLTSLHIIQKTPNAPTFVFATFSHVNNILDATGKNVEMSDGTTKTEYQTAAPFQPALTIVPSAIVNGTSVPQKVYLTNGTPAVNTNSPELYFNNTTGNYAIYTDSSMQHLYKEPVNVPRRLYPIPPTITKVNAAAQTAIKNVNPNAVWANYFLVNVQARALDVTAIPAGEEPTFFLANEVVETNPTLQHFSGRVNNRTGEPTNYQDPRTGGNPLEYYKNTYVVQSNGSVAGYTMGGCMGCHGAIGQNQGGDFSRLLAFGRISVPDSVQADEKNDVVTNELARKYFSE
jgi:hypothetical protein